MFKKRLICHITIFVWIFIISGFLLLPVCNAEFSLFTKLRAPLGITVDDNGNVFIHTDNVSDQRIAVFSPDGKQNAYIKLGGFWDVQGFSYLTTRRSDGLVFSLRQDGWLVLIDAKTMTASYTLNLRTQIASTDKIYDIAQNRLSNFDGMINTASSTYGDIAILERDTYMDIFVTGLSHVQAFPFVMRIRVDKNDNRLSINVVAASSASTAIGDFVNTTRGIAVNSQGIVATTLPYQGENGFIVDCFVTFSADFPETGKQLPEVKLNGLDMPSMGMEADQEGNFYIATGKVGTSQAGYGGSGALVKISPTGDDIIEIHSLNSILADSRDVAVSHINNRVYMTIINSNEVVYAPLTKSFVSEK